MIRFNRLSKLLIVSCLLLSTNGIGQLVFSESFTDIDGTLSGSDDIGGVNWVTSCPDCADAGDFFKVDGAKLKGQDTNGPASWTTEAIDISDCDFIEIQFDLSEEGELEACGTGCNSVDFVQFEYSIDGGAWTNPPDAFFCAGDCAGVMVIQSDDIPGGSLIYTTGCMAGGDEIRLRITIQAWAASERWIIDNVQVSCATGPDIDAGEDMTICVGTAITLEADNPDGATLAWDHGVLDGVPFTPALGTEDYVVTATDGVCTSADVVVIEVVDPVSVSISPAGPFSESGGVELLIASPLLGEWSADCGDCINPITGEFDPVSAGVGFWEVCYHAGTAPCDDSDCITIEVIEDCLIEGVISTVQPTCYGFSDGSVSIVVTEATGVVSYTISNASGDIVNVDNDNAAFDLSEGWYYFLIEDEFPCTYIDSVFLENPPVLDGTISAHAPFCLNDSPYEIDAVTIGILDGPGVVDGTFYPAIAGVGSHELSNTLDGPCGSVSTITFSVNPLPVLSFMGNELGGCLPLTVNFTNTGDAGVACEWNFGDGFDAFSCGTVTHTYYDGGLFDVSFKLTDINGCTNIVSYEDYIAVTPSPIANFTFQPLAITTFDSEVDFEDRSLNAFEWDWDFGGLGSSSDENPRFVFPQEVGEYPVKLTVTNDAGCSDSIVKILLITDPVLVYIPNVFTPDDDNLNNQFKPYFNGIDSYDYQLTIYNRWGEVVFQSFNPEFGWNGMYGDQLAADGVYIYHIITKEISTDRKLEFHGHITLLR